MDNSFMLLPMSQRITLVAGQTYTGSVTVVNPVSAKSDFAYSAKVIPYNVLDNDGKTDFSSIMPHSMIAEWIKIENPTGVLSPNESREVKFTVDVPETAPGGGQYAAIMVSLDPNAKISEDDGVNIENIYELASVIYADVSGETMRLGEIVENNIPGFVLKTPVRISALLKNDGNVHDDATFELKVRNVLTDDIIYPGENDREQFTELVMPGVTRFVTRDIENLPSLGIVEVEQKIYFAGDVSMNSQIVLICPLWFLILVTLCVVSLITLIVMMIRKFWRKRKEKRLVKDTF